MIPKFNLQKIADFYLRRAFEDLTNFLSSRIFLMDWEFYEIEFTGATSNFKKKHTLKAAPKDVIQTYKTGSGTVTFNYAQFDENFLDITTSGACKVRFFVGTYSAGG